MASSSVDPKPLLWYYVRQGFARTVISTVDESLKRRGTDSTLTFWKAVALSREGEILAHRFAFSTSSSCVDCSLFAGSAKATALMQAILLVRSGKSRRFEAAAMQSCLLCWHFALFTAPQKRHMSVTGLQRLLISTLLYQARGNARCLQATSSQASSSC